MNAGLSREEIRDRREALPSSRELVYLNHAAIAPLPSPSVRAMAELADRVSRTGDRRWPERNEMTERVRGLAAHLMGASRPETVAFVPSTSAGLSLVAEGLDWNPGDNVVGAGCEFPSNVYPWMNLASRGVEYRQAEERDGRLDLDELEELCDGRTRILALSWVQYSNGFRTDLHRLGRFCRKNGILFVADVIQGLGA
ncbi:MAG: aminotransferase class V-fold PLP-dependent enzyme, partial [Thermoanaerobaculia bacterium]|nr:aminotransferase class V-fold PLP-dependent enzyme [Thermoanaerobaculia bacterium]